MRTRRRSTCNGGSGKVVVDDDGSAVLVLERASVRASRKDLPGVGDHGQHARLGRASSLRPTIAPSFRFRRPCLTGAVVAVTIEQDGGVERADAGAGDVVRSGLSGSPPSAAEPARSRSDSTRTLVRMTDLRPPLRELFGFDDFRPGQEEVVRAAVEGRDTLALMPTGSGKSLTYQLAAMLRPEPTLVLSPLIALMKDQVDQLPPEIAATATFVNSSLDQEVTAGRIRDVADGRTRILYAAPERLRNAAFVETLRAIGVGLVVIDEVHCVSMWGHDFRPDYLFIRRALEALGDPIGARDDRHRDAGRGEQRSPRRSAATSRSSGRASSGRTCATTSRRSAATRIASASSSSGCGRSRTAVRSSTRARATRASASRGRSAATACGSSTTTRVSRQMSARGSRTTSSAAGSEGVVATTAFGMGIDKPDVRFVCLFNYPDSLESYVQMVGRGGRDGAPSETLLLASPSDATAVRRFAVGDIPGPDDLRHVYRAIRDLGGTVDPSQLPAGDHDPRVLVGMLEQAGIVRRGYDAGRAMRIELSPSTPEPARSSTTCSSGMPREATARVERIVRFAESTACRHAQVAEHFGETFDDALRRLRHLRPAPEPHSPTGRLAAAGGCRRRPSCGPSSGSRGRSAAARSSRCSAARSPPHRRPGPRSPLALLEAASDAEVKRWIKALEAAGALVEIETDDGYRVLNAVPGATLPSLGPKAAGAGGRLASSSGCARGGGSARARTASPPTSCCTTPPCATSRRRARRPCTSSPP